MYLILTMTIFTIEIHLMILLHCSLILSEPFQTFYPLMKFVFMKILVLSLNKKKNYVEMYEETPKAQCKV